MPKTAALQSRRRPRQAALVIGADPPQALSVRAAVASLRARLEYVQDVLGLRIELVALLANLSHKALRYYRLERWNPNLATLLQVEATLDKHLPGWIEDKRSASEQPKAKGRS